MSAYVYCWQIPATVASAERSFNKFTLFKEFDKLTMSQERLADLSMMAIGSYNARRIDFEKAGTAPCKSTQAY